MQRSVRARLVLLGAWFVSISCATLAQGPQGAAVYEPYVGQEGKDVVWAPTPPHLVERILDLAKLRADDFLIDLGSGDGRMVIAAARRGAKALGVEFNSDMVRLARQHAREAGVSDKAHFRRADLFRTDLSEATVVTMFLLPEINLKLRPRLLQLAPGTRIVSNTYRMGSWKPDGTATVRKDCGDYCTAYLWIVPARVAGTWNTTQGVLTLKQRFQHFSGTLLESEPAAVTDGTLRGDVIRFTAGGVRYEGRVTGDRIEGTASTQGRSIRWTAAKS
jgi:SAM-dependent methyltransferase